MTFDLGSGDSPVGTVQRESSDMDMTCLGADTGMAAVCSVHVIEELYIVCSK